MLRTITVIIAIFFLVSVPAYAEKPVNYATVKLGVYSPTQSDTNDFGNGFNGEISFGHYFNPHIAGEIGVGYFSVDGDFTGAFNAVIVTEKDKIKVYPVTITGKGIIPYQQGELYGGGGIGVYFAEVESDIGNLGLGRESHTSNDTAFGVHMLVGGNHNITPNIYIGGELRYFFASANFNATFFGTPLTMSADLDGFIATVNLGYRF